MLSGRRMLTWQLHVSKVESMAEDNLKLTWRGALMHQRRSVMSVGESGRTSVLEKQRKRRRFASMWTVVMPSAAELVFIEGLTAALAGYHLAVAVRRVELQLAWAGLEEVGLAADHRADTVAFVWGYG